MNPSDRLKILIVSSHMKEPGGAEKNVIDLAAGLKDLCDVEVAALQGGYQLDLVRAAGVPAADLAVRRLISFDGLRKAIRLYRKLKSENFDLVLTYHRDADFWAGAAAMAAGLPVVSSRRDMGFLLSKLDVGIYRIINRFFSRIIVVADAVRREVVRTQGADEGRIVTIHNGLRALPSADRAAARRSLGVEDSALVIGMVAALRPIKNQKLVVRAAGELCGAHPEARFLLVGPMDHPYAAEVQALIRERGLSDRVRCVDNREDVGRVLSAFDIFVLSSYQEGFSNALIEAMSAGLPAVATAVGGNPETIKNGLDGFLVPSDDAAALSERLSRLLGDAALRRRMGEAARATVEARFSYDGMIGKVFSVLNEAAGRTAARAGVHAVAATHAAKG